VNSGQTFDQSPDSWDLWQALSYAATGFSALSLLSSGREGKEFGQAGTLLGIASSALHYLAAPPRCSNCRCRMTRLAPGSGWVWLCSRCGNQTS
jgi:hypothetical protein